MKKTFFILLASGASLLGQPAFAQSACNVTLNAGASISNAVSSAASGSTICLNAGSYPAFNSSISKSSMTTVTAAPGLSPSQVTISSVNVGSSQNLAFVGMTIGGAAVGVPGGAAALHIRFKNNAFTGPLDIYTPQNLNQDTLIDGNTFNNVASGVTEGRLGVRGYNNTATNGVVISNNVFSGSGPSDGVQIIGGAYGTVIGPGNEFKNIKESGCGTIHCDPIQFYGASNTRITGNYFHNNSTGLMLGSINNITIDNNVLMTDGEYPDQIVIFVCGDKANAIRHNTLANGASIRLQNDGCGSNVYETVYDNIVTGSVHADSGLSMATAKVGYNLTPGSLSGTNNIVGKPTYIGGASPATWAGYQLTTTSAGAKAASDGKDIGTNYYGPGTVAPPPPTGQTLFTTQTPQLLNNSDGVNVNYELGMRFIATAAGQIKAIRFYKSPSESGTHTGKIYSSSGQLLASVTFTNETASGWQTQSLASPLSIAANTEYTVSVNTGNTYYVTTDSGLASQVSNGYLKSVVGGNGVYGPVGAKPTQSWQNSNYFRDVVFAPS